VARPEFEVVGWDEASDSVEVIAPTAPTAPSANEFAETIGDEIPF
jgi:hypothetical protein